jgi:hypothetical protein
MQNGIPGDQPTCFSVNTAHGLHLQSLYIPPRSALAGYLHRHLQCYRPSLYQRDRYS